MPEIEVSSLHQKAVLWAYYDTDGNGEPRVSEPVEIDCRWEHVVSQMLSPQGEPIAVDGEVFVDRVIAVGSVLWKGALADLPATPTALKEVLAYVEVPDIKGRNYERSVLTRRFRESLPTVV